MTNQNRREIPSVIVFVTAYNEEGAIARTIDAIHDELAQDKYAFRFETIVIDDGCTDSTCDIARKKGVKVISHQRNRGLGACTRTGMQSAFEMGADIAIKVDGDAQYVMRDLEKMIRPILDGKADVVFGSRFLGNVLYKMPVHRAYGNAFFSWLTGFLIGTKVTDSATGLIAFHRRYLSQFEILVDYNATQQLLINSWGRNMRVTWVPIDFRPRESGRSFISWKYPFRVVPAMLRSYFHARLLRSSSSASRSSSPESPA